MSGARILWWPVGVVLPGFVALWLFWQFGDRPPGLPGLFDFRSATWGDGLLLPLLALCLRKLTERLPTPAGPVRRRVVTAGASAGAVVGVAVIVSWLADDAASPNWTMPRPHVLNAAGVWHAVFLVAACAVFAGLTADFALHLRRAGEAAVRKSLTSSWAAVALACTAGYAWLAAADAAPHRAGLAGAATLTALTVTVALLLLALLFLPGGYRREYANTLLTAGLLTSSLLTVAVTHPPGGAFAWAALASTTASAVGLVATTDEGLRISAVEGLGVWGLFTTVTVYVSSEHSGTLWLVSAAPLAAAGGSVALRAIRFHATGAPHQSRITGTYLSAAGISACLLTASTFGAWLGGREDNQITGGFVLTIVGAVLGGIFFQSFKGDFERLMDIEGDPALRSAGAQPSPQQAAAATRVWIRILAYGVAAFSAVLVLAISVARSLGWTSGTRPVDWSSVLLVTAAAAVCAGCAHRALVRAWRRHEQPRPAPERSSAAVWACGAGGAVTAVLAAAAVLRDASVNPLAMLQAVLVTVFATEAVLGNGAWLHFARLRTDARCAVGAVAAATGLTVYWSLTALIRPGGHAASLGESLAAWFAVTLAVFALTLVALAAVYSAGGLAYRTDYPPLKNGLQDCYLLGLLCFTLGWTPQTVLAHVPAAAPERWAAIGTILAGFMLTFCPPFLWVLENNDTHVCRQRLHCGAAQADGPLLTDGSIDRIRGLPRRIRSYHRAVRAGSATPDADAYIRRLSGHTAVQNATALLLAGVSLIGAAGLTSGFSARRQPPGS